jgi:hypothetical protein
MKVDVRACSGDPRGNLAAGQSALIERADRSCDLDRSGRDFPAIGAQCEFIQGRNNGASKNPEVFLQRRIALRPCWSNSPIRSRQHRFL